LALQRFFHSRAKVEGEDELVDKQSDGNPLPQDRKVAWISYQDSAPGEMFEITLAKERSVRHLAHVKTRSLPSFLFF
jgi:hypothetical protein